MSGHVNLKKLVTVIDQPDFGETHYVVDANFRTQAQGWTRADGTGPLDLWAERNPGYVYGSGASSGSGLDYGTDSAAIQGAVDAAIDYRGDKVFLLPGSYSLATAIAVNCPGIRIMGPPVRNLRQSRVLITDAIGSGLTLSVTDVELGYFTAVPKTATAFMSVGNASNFGYVHDIYYNALGVAASTSTEFCNAVATNIDWLVERCTFNVDAAQGDAFTLDSPTRWVVQDSDFYVNITAIAWASVFTFTTTALGNVVRRNMFRGCGGATAAVFTNIFTGIANVNGQLMAYLNFVDGTAQATATDIETTFGTTTDIELAENYQTGDATTEGGKLIVLA